MKNRIIEIAKKEFFKFGYNRVRVNDIAEELGISKKTIYNYFTGKEQIVYSVIDNSYQLLIENIESIENDTNKEYKDRILDILKLLGIWTLEQQVFVSDIKKSCPQAYTYFITLQKEIILKYGVKILKYGQKEGRINEGSHHYVALYMFLTSAEKINDADYRKSFPKELINKLPSNPSELLTMIFDVIYGGIKKEIAEN